MAHPLILAGSASNTTEVATFWVLAVLAVAAALGMILTRRAVHCAVMLAVVMLILAAMYAMQGAPFLAFVQVIVYTGAVQKIKEVIDAGRLGQRLDVAGALAQEVDEPQAHRAGEDLPDAGQLVVMGQGGPACGGSGRIQGLN